MGGLTRIVIQHIPAAVSEESSQFQFNVVPMGANVDAFHLLVQRRDRTPEDDELGALNIQID